MTTLTNHSVSPRYTNAISPPYPVTLNDENGPINLTGVQPTNFTLTLWDINNPSVVIIGTGTWTIIDALNGKASYQWSSADLSTPSVYHAYTTVKLPGEPGIRAFDPDLIVVSTLPGVLLTMATQDVNLLQVAGVAISPTNPVPTSSATIGAATDAGYSAPPGSVTATSVIALLRTLADKFSQNAPVAGYVAPFATNAAATVGNTDYAFKWGASGNTTVNHIMLQNNTAANVQYELDTAATVASPVLAAGATIFIDVPCSTLHLFTATAQNVNGTTAGNIVVRAWL